MAIHVQVPEATRLRGLATAHSCAMPIDPKCIINLPWIQVEGMLFEHTGITVPISWGTPPLLSTD